jgi:hypothetical protein
MHNVHLADHDSCTAMQNKHGVTSFPNDKREAEQDREVCAA